MNKNSKGFTLIETMVVVVLVAMLLVGVSGLLVSNLRGGGKATILADLRDEGDGAMFRMERELRYAEILDMTNCIENTTEIAFLNQEDEQIMFEFVDGKIIRRYSFDGGDYVDDQALFGGEVEIAKEGDPLAWANVKPFDCIAPANDFESAVVRIKFRLTPGGDAEVQQEFESSVSLRN